MISCPELTDFELNVDSFSVTPLKLRQNMYTATLRKSYWKTKFFLTGFAWSKFTGGAL